MLDTDETSSSTTKGNVSVSQSLNYFTFLESKHIVLNYVCNLDRSYINVTDASMKFIKLMAGVRQYFLLYLCTQSVLCKDSFN